ncbi:type 1 fimbrial protein [Serratia sp. 3ACOL1]|uniref:type 1 fimbrial protein n=1 Tax=Serratia sp. 3ACOL1 TaxID=2448483 RepID=UPI00139031A0|nr:type 1 fimbrial protein [Serratia sp. 3ACOL1]
MMNKQTLGMIGVAILVSATATAAPVANLKINGDIKPPTCTVNGGDQADLIYNLGAVSPSVIPQSTGYNGLLKNSNTLTVSCDAATYLTFKATDVYPNPFIQAPGMNINYRAHAFNMVDVNAPDKTVGGISYYWKTVTADGQTAFISRANDGTGDNGTWSRPNWLVKDATSGWTKTQQTYVNPTDLDLLSAKEFSATLINDNTLNFGWALTYLLSKDELTKQGIDISNGVDYTSNVTLTFNFGV